MSKSLKPFAATCATGDVFRDDGGKLFLFDKSVRHCEDQAELLLVFDLTSAEIRDLVYPLDVFRTELTLTSRMMRPLNFPAKPGFPHPEGTLFRHTDGGYYRFSRCATHARTGEALVIYDHVWPFEQSAWARPVQQFLSKFSVISAGDLAAAMAEDRAAVQSRITTARLARKAALTK